MLLTIGLSPAWQQLFSLSELRPGEVNRAREVRWCAAGKSLDVAFAARALGAEVCALTLLGGANGARIAAEVTKAGIRLEALEVAAETRICTTVLADGGLATELVEPAAPVPGSAVDALCARADALLAAAEVVVFSGSLPSGCRRGVFAEIARSADRAGVALVADIRGEELKALLAAAAHRRAPSPPWIVKPNRVELGETLGAPCAGDAALADGIEELRGDAGTWVLVSDGAAPAWLVGPGQPSPRVLLPPRAVRVKNPIGAGDALAAGLAVALAAGDTVIDAARRGLATAGASCETPLPGRLSGERAEELSAQTRLA